MDDFYAINAAKTEFRDSFNSSDASRLLALVDVEFVNFSDGEPSEFGQAGLDTLRQQQPGSMKSSFHRSFRNLKNGRSFSNSEILDVP